MTDTTTLTPCPFCGAQAHFEVDDDRWEWVECESCGMQGNRSASLMESCKPKLAEAWNRRAPAPANDALEKAVRKLHAAKGRHHNQIAACDLYDLLGLPNFRPGQEPTPSNGEDVSPFGYFRAEPFGWTDCAESDEGAKPLYEKPQAHSDLHAAAQALVDRWDTPRWKDVEHTGAFIQRLREALAVSPEQKPKRPLSDAQVLELLHSSHFHKKYVLKDSDRTLIAWYRLGLRDGERAHGITAAQKEAP